jgi:hypothetical protein
MMSRAHKDGGKYKNQMDRERVVRTWACSGIKDFFLAFCLCETFNFQKPFFYHQGLEKLCKAYILGQRSSEYEHFSDIESKDIIDRIAREYKHDLIKLIKNLIKEGVLGGDTLTKKQCEYYGHELTGKDMAKLLVAGYTECRYPVKDPSYKNYPIPNINGGYAVPLHSSDPRDFAHNLGQILNEKIERDFQVSTFDTLNNKKIFFKRDDWIRFCRIFYKRELDM